MDSITFFYEIKALIQNKKEREAVYLIMRKVDEWLYATNFDSCKMLLKVAHESINELSIKTIHALLAITFAANKDLCPERNSFYVEAYKYFKDQFNDDARVERLLKSLR